MKVKLFYDLRRMAIFGASWNTVRDLRYYRNDVEWRREMQVIWKKVGFTNEQL